jgi:hypothetical protein
MSATQEQEPKGLGQNTGTDRPNSSAPAIEEMASAGTPPPKPLGAHEFFMRGYHSLPRFISQHHEGNSASERLLVLSWCRAKRRALALYYQRLRRYQP